MLPRPRFAARGAAVLLLTLGCAGCGGSSGDSNTATPTAPTQPAAAPAFAVSARVLQVTPAQFNTGLQETTAPPVTRELTAELTVTETGGRLGGRLDELLSTLLTKSGATSATRLYGSQDVLSIAGSNRIPAGGKLLFNVFVNFKNTSGDIAETLRTSTTITGDDGSKATPSTTSTVPPPAACVANHALCLSGARFHADVTWRQQSQTGTGTGVPVSDEEGRFWFFSPNTMELTVKVLNSCNSAPQRYWVYVASTTSIEWALTVTDTKTGAVKRYVNPLGQRLPPVTDMEAFATCP